MVSYKFQSLVKKLWLSFQYNRLPWQQSDLLKTPLISAFSAYNSKTSSIDCGPVDDMTESFENVLMSPGGGMKWMLCHLEAKVSLLAVYKEHFWVLVILVFPSETARFRK